VPKFVAGHVNPDFTLKKSCNLAAQGMG